MKHLYWSLALSLVLISCQTDTTSSESSDPEGVIIETSGNSTGLQPGDPVFNTDQAQNISWSYELSKSEKYSVGDTLKITFVGTPAKDWHLYSSIEKEAAYRPTLFEVFSDESKGIETVGTMQESPKYHEEYDDLMQGYLRSFEKGPVRFTQPLVITGAEVVITANLSYQICKEGMCMFGDLPFSYSFSATK